VPKKSNLLKELGWNDALIRHFMVEDGEFVNQAKTELKTEVFETSSFTMSYNALASGTTAILTINRNKRK